MPEVVGGYTKSGCVMFRFWNETWEGVVGCSVGVLRLCHVSALFSAMLPKLYGWDLPGTHGVHFQSSRGFLPKAALRGGRGQEFYLAKSFSPKISQEFAKMPFPIFDTF